jgi:hypothetical protein
MGKIVLIVLAVLLGIAGWVVAGYFIYREGTSSVRVANLESTISELTDGATKDAETIRRLRSQTETDRREFAKRVADIIAGFGKQDQIDREIDATIERLGEVHSRIAN